MLDIKLIRKDPDFFIKKLSERNTEVNIKDLLNLDKKNRDLIQNREKFEQEKKVISQKKDKNLFNRSKEISLEIDQLITEQTKIEKQIYSIISSLPNIALEDVPVGKDEGKNKEVKKIGEITKFDFEPLAHDEIGKNIEQMDFDSASKTSGARFVFLKKQLALLERAISNFMLDVHTKEFGYLEISPPLIVNDETMFGTGQLPKFESDQFELKVDVDQSLCIGCCSCEMIAPGVFTIDKNTKSNPKSRVYNKNGAKNQKIISAAETCPTKAIIVDNLDENQRIYPY